MIDQFGFLFFKLLDKDNNESSSPQIDLESKPENKEKKKNHTPQKKNKKQNKKESTKPQTPLT